MLRRSLLHFRHRKMFSSIPPPVRPTDWKSAAPEPLPGTVTFAAQPNLPRLPVPDLKQTLDRLRESLKPIAWSDSEYSSVLQKIDTFANDLGPQLQQRLLDRASERPHWLEEWWDNIGYLGYRDSVRLYKLYILACGHLYNIIIQVVVNVSYYCEDPRIKTYLQ
jgi:carnitine O-acetyltransferase